jgi:hypothetical protein
MGCQFVMAIEDFYSAAETFTECEGEVAAAPGLYVQPDGSTSTFRQRYTGSYTNDGTVGYWTVGQTVTPSAPAFWPKSSNCQTYSTISNGVDTANWQVTAAPSVLRGGSTIAASDVGSTSMDRPSGLPSGSSNPSGSRSGSASASGASNTSGTASGSGSSSSGRASNTAASGAAANTSNAANARASLNMPGMASLAALVGAGALGAAAVLL